MLAHAVSARRALITGVTGQDGSYLAELLLEQGYAVHGLARPGSAVPEGVTAVEGDLDDHGSLRAAMAEVQPEELYHRGAPTFVPTSWEEPELVLRQVTE